MNQKDIIFIRIWFLALKFLDHLSSSLRTSLNLLHFSSSSFLSYLCYFSILLFCLLFITLLLSLLFISFNIISISYFLFPIFSYLNYWFNSSPCMLFSQIPISFSASVFYPLLSHFIQCKGNFILQFCFLSSFFN